MTIVEMSEYHPVVNTFMACQYPNAHRCHAMPCPSQMIPGSIPSTYVICTPCNAQVLLVRPKCPPTRYLSCCDMVRV